MFVLDPEKNKIARAMRRVRELTELVLTGKKPMQMFCSLPGIGKTEAVLEVMKKHNLKPHYSSPLNPAAFCRDLWAHRDASFFLDDCDVIARSEPCANIAKMAWGAQRLVIVPNSLEVQKNEQRRQEASPNYNPRIPPPTFRLDQKHGVIWNSNDNFTDPATVAKKMAGDFAALVSRGLDPLWIPSDPQAVFEYTIWLVIDGMLRRHPQADLRNDRGGFKLAHQQAVLDFMCAHAEHLKEISPRMAFKLAAARRDDPSWQEAWHAQLAGDPLRKLELPDTPPKLFSPAMRRAQNPPPPQPTAPEPVPEPIEKETPAPAPVLLLPAPAPLAEPALRPIPGAPPGAPVRPFPVDPKERRRQQKAADTISHKQLPKRNRLKAAVAAMDKLRQIPVGAEQLATSQRACDFLIDQTVPDDPRFVGCETFADYMARAEQIERSAQK